MATLQHQILGDYLSAGAKEDDFAVRRLARASYIRDLVRYLYQADKDFGLAQVDTDDLGSVVDAAEEYVLQVSRNVGLLPDVPVKQGGGDPR